MLIMGIDPGTARIGYGFVKVHPGGKLVVMGYGCATTPAKEQTDIRLASIYEQMIELIDEFRPDSMAVEQLFFNRNVTTALSVGQARGVIILAGAHRSLPIAEYTPLQVKQAVTGQGRAVKSQVGFMIKLLLGLSEIPKPDDVADALAVAICHAYNGRGWGLG